MLHHTHKWKGEIRAVCKSLSHFYTIPTQGLVPPLVGRHSNLSQHNKITPTGLLRKEPNLDDDSQLCADAYGLRDSRTCQAVNQQSHNPPQGAGPHQHLLTYSIPRTRSEAFSCILDQVPQNHSLVHGGLRTEGRKECRAKWVFAGISFRSPLWGTLGTDGSSVNPH